MVIAAGGGGIPVVADEAGDLTGVPAVIDKDHASRILANHIGAELFVMSTDVEQVALNFGTPEERRLSTITAAEAKQYHAEGHFPDGSMGPKVEAVRRLHGGTSKPVVAIGGIDDYGVVVDPDHVCITGISQCPDNALDLPGSR